MKGHFEIVAFLAEKSDIDLEKGFLSNGGLTPLQIACREGNIEIAEELLKHPRIDVNSFGIILRELRYSEESLEERGMIGALLCKRGNVRPSDYLDKIKDQELIAKIYTKLDAPKKSARS
eukprot:CAMPEP_0117029076 /NCGR_PEP_ID=MMETSP0472-20121206/21087_1 /TAXON_ID=693140 ORGANISM="Tiarina fusus, Strain LIS" /NCGR_SAMPLE_ID=MMETSP0472 /ASSEMBLY_ACC=CAM_ASM_000603 /LENGTH=119 /DNA_ID=CAMNT_0004736745 /DNA_START=137 /DNA_END=496 /DNA_ORIENTATION=-